MANDLDRRRAAQVISPHAARLLRTEIRRYTSNLTLAPLADNNTTTSPTHCQGTPKGHFHCPASQVPKQVVALTDLEDPFGPWANSECIKITQRDLRRCGDDLDLLRQCAAERGADIFEPCPSPAHGAGASGANPCVAAGGHIIGIDKVTLQLQALWEGSKAERAKGHSSVPCVKGRWSNIDQLPQLFERRGAGGQRGHKVRTLSCSGSSTSVGSGTSSGSTSRVASRPTSRPVSRSGSNPIAGDAGTGVSSNPKRCFSTPLLLTCDIPDL